MAKTKLKRKDVLKEVLSMFALWEVVLFVSVYFALHYGLFLYLTESSGYSIAMGVIGAGFFFLVFTRPNRKLKRYQNDLGELMKYVTNVSFYIRSGENVYYALEQSIKSVSSNIRKDIQKTIDILDDKGTLDTTHFEKYEFATLNQFHHNLLIKYERGGDTVDLFDNIQQDMIFELKKRDELHKRKKAFAVNAYALLGMVSGMMLVLAGFVPYLWSIFLEMREFSFTIITISYLLVLINLTLLQKKNLDVSVRI